MAKISTFDARVFNALKVLRKLFRNTGVHQLRLTGWIYTAVMKKMTSGSADYLVEFRSMKLAMEPGDVTLLPSVISGDFEELELNWYEDWLRARSNANKSVLVVDIGANIGIFSVLAKKHLLENSLVLAIEPDLRNIRRLELNLNENSGSAITKLLPLAVSGTKGTIRFSISKFGGTNHIANFGDTNVLEVPCTTLKDLVEEHMTPEYSEMFIKIDVEGFEPQVVKGGIDVIESLRPTLMLEISRDRLSEEFGDNHEMVNSLFQIYRKGSLIDADKIEQVDQGKYMQALRKHHLATLLFEP